MQKTSFAVKLSLRCLKFLTDHIDDLRLHVLWFYSSHAQRTSAKNHKTLQGQNLLLTTADKKGLQSVP